LTNVPEVTSSTSIKFTWDDPLEDGGSPILDYDVYYNQGSDVDSIVLLSADLLVREFETSIPLTSGELYTFYVSARNSVGEGAMSEFKSIYASTIPDAPIQLTNVPGITTGF
jgi:hypothetical protein